MVDCSHFLDNRNSHINNNAFKPYKGATTENFLCPNVTSLVVRGDFVSDNFSYIKISVKGCDKTEEECLDIYDFPENLTL